jgi:transposase
MMRLTMDAILPNEMSPLRELVSTLQATLAAVQTENQLLRQKLEFFIKRYFGGTKNESLDPKQLELLLAGLEALTVSAPVVAKPTPVRATATARPVRQALPAHLETERVVLEPEEVKQQPAGWRKLGEEVTEELDWKPAKFIKRLYIRPKYANAERIVMAPLPARLIEKGLPGAGLLTQVILSKYEDHLPLYRQAKIYHQRHGVNLSRQTLCGWVEAAADWLSPIYREMKAGLQARDYLQADETPIRYLDPDVKGKSQQGWLWTYSHPQGDVVFDWNVSRSREGPREFLKDFKGKPRRMVMGCMNPCLGSVAANWFCSAAGRMCVAASMTPWAKGASPRGSWGRSGCSTAWKNTCANKRPGPSCGRPCARGKAGPFWSGCAGRWNGCGAGCCRKVCWARPLTMPCGAGRP